MRVAIRPLWVVGALGLVGFAIGAIVGYGDAPPAAALSSGELLRLECAPDAIVGIGPDGRIVLVTAQSEKLCSWLTQVPFAERA